MSETSSDAESSGGWTIISNEGSDIETLGSEAAVEYGAGLLERPPVEEPEVQDGQALTLAVCVEEQAADSLDDTLETLVETLCTTEASEEAAGKQQMLCSSDHSDIVTLGDEHAEVEVGAATHEEFYLGTSCSSHYAFTAAETAGLLLSHWKLPQSLLNLSYHLRSQLTGSRSVPVFPVQQPSLTNSSSSEDEHASSTVTRRRRLRKNTTSVATEEEDEEVLPESHHSEEDKDEEVKEEKEKLTKIKQTAAAVFQGRWRSILTTCILLTIFVVICMGFGHFFGATHGPAEEFYYQGIHYDYLEDFMFQDHDEQKVISELTETNEKIKRENQELKMKQLHIQAQRDHMEMLLKQKAEERTNIMSQQQGLMAENQRLKSSLEHEETSSSTLQEELRNLHSTIRDLEAKGAGADSLSSENQKLKDQLEEKRQLIRNYHSQKEDMRAEALTLRKKLDKERQITEELRRELNHLRSQEEGSETEELQSRLMELEKRLSFEQQRSDLWERLYVETKEERAKGDTESKVKKTKGMAGTVKETFDAVKNSTKEFVHHHKEQIKKAKEAVKENLRKFSDSVKSTFRHFKDSASTIFNKARGFYKKRNDENRKDSWQHRSHKPHHRSDSFQSDHNTRKSGNKVHEDQGQNSHRSHMKGCSGVFNCAYQESMSLFNKAMEPIRADEFYQLLQSYLQQEVDHFHHWKELEMFINNFFHNGLFIHDQMLFTDFVRDVEDYLTDMHEYHGLDMFGDLDDFVYKHFFGKAYRESYGPSGPFEGPETDSKEEVRAKHHQRKQQGARSRPHRERKCSRRGKNSDRPMTDVKIELGPMPFDPKY
ncbi:cell cycle progression protein 1 isoform X3 [Parambassis ranga]|uniref:Cell cycle progression protein 1 isoform X3 n=1 Tax=Parambassis ranga TaxID=210632 RepID=A0A6P7HPA6_9TELE|nr:cell cycle progression protein 1 isoform X3 [Parambassis ranga]XP_028257455.1 cell cycle progression protein 1 isoform X3 [Parambassis ranga]